MTEPTTSSEVILQPSHASRQRPNLIRQVLAEGGPGFCQFAINNACNAGCEFCSFNLDVLPRKDWIFAPPAKASAAIDILARHGVRYLVLTGGEPMLHPDLYEILDHARRCRMVLILVTNGSRLDSKNIHRLKA